MLNKGSSIGIIQKNISLQYQIIHSITSLEYQTKNLARKSNR